MECIIGKFYDFIVRYIFFYIENELLTSFGSDPPFRADDNKRVHESFTFSAFKTGKFALS